MPIATVKEVKKAPVKLEDVALAADVSVATVSLALRNHHSVTEDTRRRVVEAKKRLGYKPLRKRNDASKPAKEKSQHRQTFLYCIVDFPVKKYEYTAFLEGVMSACQEKRIRVELASISSDAILSADVSHTIPPEASGVILTGDLNQELVDRFRKQGLAIIALGNYNLRGIHKIEVDIVRAGGFVAQRMIEEGHKEAIGILGNPKNYYERQYLMGVRDVMSMHGLELPSSKLFYADDLDLFGSISKIVEKVMVMKPAPTAVICHAVNVSEAFLAEYRAHAKSGNIASLPSIYTLKTSSKEPPNPHISMLNINLEQIGRLAVSNLRQIIAHREPFVYATVLEVDDWEESAK